MSGKRLNSAEKERIESLTAQGLTPNRIARKLNRSHHTISKYVAEPDAQEAIAGKLQDVVLRTVSSVSDSDIEKANLVAKLTAIGIAVDKIRLIRGQPTQINVTMLLDAVSAIKEMRRRQAESCKPQPQLASESGS